MKQFAKTAQMVSLKNFDISAKIVSLQCFWIRRLYDNCFHKWKLIKLHLITMSFRSNFRLGSNIFLKKASLKKLLPFCRDIFINQKAHVSSSPETPGCIISQFLWFSKYIQMEDNPVYLTKFAAKDINFFISNSMVLLYQFSGILKKHSAKIKQN